MEYKKNKKKFLAFKKKVALKAVSDVSDVKITLYQRYFNPLCPIGVFHLSRNQIINLLF